MIYQNVRINGIDMLKTYRMALKERHCVQPPEPKTFFQDIPGADGSLDLSTAISGHLVYNRRKITLNFGCGYEMEKWPGIFSEILRLFHGKEGHLIFDEDPNYYYTGRMIVSKYSRTQTLGTFTIALDADPYKYELFASDEDWLWDLFSFDDGIIREYKDIPVSDSYTLTIPGTERWVVPEITVTSDMTVDFDGGTYELKTGVNKIYDIIIKEGEQALIFHGSGSVTVSYRGGVL